MKGWGVGHRWACKGWEMVLSVMVGKDGQVGLALWSEELLKDEACGGCSQS